MPCHPHRILKRQIFFMATSLGSPVVQVPEEQTNHFLDLLVCPSSATKDRWQSNSSLNPHGHEEGSPAHFVTFDAQNQIQDTIYVLGGTDSVGGVDAVVNAVDKITNPVPGAIFDTSPLDLHTAREHLNSVIGADGALFVIGGEDDANAYGCVERYDPPEVFGTSAGTSWFLQAGQQHARVYHSVAGLLDDGRIFSAGGVDNPHSIEVYSPRYMFRGQRPVVSGMSATTWSYNQSTNGPTFSVAFRPGITFQRMHLIKSCSVTHGFDESQRFVSLRLGVGITGSNPYTVTVETPKDRWVAPRGDYMLFVVGSDGVPSVGTWTHLQ